MKTMRKLVVLIVVAFTGAIVFYACSKNDSASSTVVPPGKQQLNLYLTDGPDFFFDQVLVDIQSVKVLVDTCDRSRGFRNWDNDRNDSCLVWDSLAIRAGVYDLLTLRNGVDTLFATGIIPEGRIKKIQIKLGTNNSLVKDSVSYPLNLAPGSSSTITLKVDGHGCEEFKPGRFRLWLDFDAHHSIVKVRNNMFWLRPVIHLFLQNITGSIEGKVGPGEAEAIVSVFGSSDTAYALPFHDGQFKVRGLEAGTYSVFINGSNGYQDTTITNVTVEEQKETDLGKITLHK
jgi:hypothetical protein